MTTRLEFRKSQGVVPFGVGAIIDFPEESLMMAGLDAWPTESAEGEALSRMLKATQVFDGRLAKRLSTNLSRKFDYFLSPVEAPEGFGFGTGIDGRGLMPFVRFPNWHFCPRCRVLKRIAWNTQAGGKNKDSQLRCSHTGRRTKGKAKPCGMLPVYRRPYLAPVRFVAACENGHIMDFPWDNWAHLSTKASCGAGNGHLYLYSTPAAGLAGVVVECVSCGAKRTMAGSFRRNTLDKVYGGICPSERPWLGPDATESSCSKTPQTVQRGASNAYFARVVTSILIPPYSALVQQILDQPDTWSEIKAVPIVDGVPHEPLLRVMARNRGVDPDVFVEAVAERLRFESEDSGGATVGEISDEEYRFAEYKAFLGTRPPKQERHDFDTKARSPNSYGGWFSELFDSVVLVPRLRETRVLTGFSRIVPPEALDCAPAALSRKTKNWLPGFTVRGEGIFLRLNSSSLNSWLRITAVGSRTTALRERISASGRSNAASAISNNPDFILVHTLAHLLIRQLAFECGYDSSSMRERLYVSRSPGREMHGLLIYTASGDSEGTLGGLVRQGKCGRLEKTLRAAMENAWICSSDPLCIESEGQGLYSLNLAACHACALMPETSCEFGNILLDRALVIGTPDSPQLGYFSSIL